MRLARNLLTKSQQSQCMQNDDCGSILIVDIFFCQQLTMYMLLMILPGDTS